MSESLYLRSNWCEICETDHKDGAISYLHGEHFIDLNIPCATTYKVDASDERIRGTTGILKFRINLPQEGNPSYTELLFKLIQESPVCVNPYPDGDYYKIEGFFIADVPAENGPIAIRTDILGERASSETFFIDKKSIDYMMLKTNLFKEITREDYFSIII